MIPDVATDSNPDNRQRIIYPFDLNKAKESIQQFNKSPAFCAADVLLDRHFKDSGTALDPQTIAERVVLLDGLYGTKVYLQPGAQDRTIERLAHKSATVLARFQTLDERALEDRPEDVIRVSRCALEVVFTSADGGTVRQNYSFATKFFHWVTRHHFPIMDSKSRRGITRIQQGCASLPAADRVHPDPQLPYKNDYRCWIYFYSDVIAGLTEGDREALCQLDYDSQPLAYRMKHTLVRILDKVLYIQGGEGVVVTNAPGVPPPP